MVDKTLDFDDALGHPSRIDRYMVRGLLGRGGMGSVFLGFDDKLAREVAIKVITTDDVEELSRLRVRFHREVRAVAMLHHPNIIELLDYSGPDAKDLFMVMERLSGRPLDAVAQTRLLSEAEAAAVAYEVADALGHAHDKGIIHRDIKPENIFIEPNGRVVLTDFGIVKGTAQLSGATFVGTATAVVGTPLFASLEQLTRPDSISTQSDLFSLGTVLYNVMSGQFPYPAQSMAQLVHALNGTPVPLKDVARVSDEMNDLVMRMVTTAPAGRPKQARDVQRSLRPILERARIFDLKATIRGALQPRQEQTMETQPNPQQQEQRPTVMMSAAEKGLLEVPFYKRVWVWLVFGVLMAGAAFAAIYFALV